MATPQTTVDTASIKARVRLARRVGYALLSNELMTGVVAVAPVLDGDGRPAGAVHIAGQLGEWRAEEFGRKFGPMAAEAAQAARAH